jgi:hypothetical protein
MEVKSNMRLHSTILFITGVILICTCTTSLTGNSSETNNGVTVVARAGVIEGCAPSYSTIYLIPGTYRPFDPKLYDSVHTDTSGKFLFEVSDGNYNMFCYGCDGLSAMVRVSVNDTIVSGDTIFETLSVPGSVQGHIPSAADGVALSYFYIEGSTFFTRVGQDGYFHLDSIPEGNYTIKQLSVVNSIKFTSDTLSYEMTSTVKVSSDSVTVLKLR